MAKLEDLKELAKAVHRNKVKNIHVIGNNNDQTTIFDEFYQSLLDEKFSSDEEYARFFYGESANHKAYYKLKDRLWERLVNSLFFIDVNHRDFSLIQKAYYQSYKNAAAVKILLGRNIRIPAINLGEKVLKKCIKFDFTELVLNCARILRSHYGQVNPDNQKFKYYDNLLKKYKRIYQAELLAEKYYSKILLDFFQVKKDRQSLIDKANKYSKHLKKIVKKNKSYKLILTASIVFISCHEIQYNYRGVLRASNEAIKYFKENPHLITAAVLISFFRKILLSHLALKNYAEGIKIAKVCLTLEPPSSINWINSCDYYFRILLHSGQFANAYDVFKTAIEQEEHIKKYNLQTEIWKINEAFIHYLIRIGKIPSDEKSRQLKPFRLSRFLNEVPTYSKDKRGSNITILILQVLFLLEDSKFDAIIDRNESLKAYTYRYLKDDDTFRSNCFIKMLLCLPGAGFQKEQLTLKARKYLDRLHQVPIEKAKQSAELEVMPYEMLWEFLLESLDRQKK